jgi:exopolysaccharide biosynthesis WecB/TagA/CpsF family protein
MNSSNHWMLQNRLFQWTTQQALSQIDQIYSEQGFCVVSYVYGAVVVRNNLLSFWTQWRIYSSKLDPSCLRTTRWQEGLFASDLILPDGAALLTWWRVAHCLGRVVWVPKLSNLNGTDFFPDLLEYYLAQWPINLVCFGTYGGSLSTRSGDVIIPAGEWLQKNYWIKWSYWQDIDYHDTITQRDWDAMLKSCDPRYPIIMMVCLGVPRQETWSYQNRENIRKYHIIACNQWATIDYWAGREIRAPQIVRKLRLESVWRLISDPRKNWSKFWVSFMMMWEIVTLVIEWGKNKVKVGWR